MFRIQSTASQSLFNGPIFYMRTQIQQNVNFMQFGWNTVYLTESMIIGRGNIQLQYRTQESRHDSFDMKAQHQLVSGRQL